MITIKNIKEAAVAFWRLQKWVSSVDVDRKIAAESSLRTLKDFLKENEVDVIDLTGKLYDPGLSVEVMYFEDEDTESENIPTIVEMMRPIILQNGNVVEFGQVVIAKNPEIIAVKEPEDVSVDKIIDTDDFDNKTAMTSPNKEKTRILLLVSTFVSIAACLVISVFFVIQAKKVEINNNDLLNSQSKLQTEFDQYKQDVSKKLDQIHSSIIAPSSSTDTFADSISWHAYIVNSGDTLTSVCETHNIDFYAWEKVILSSNGIENSNKIYVGQALMLPILQEGE